MLIITNIWLLKKSVFMISTQTGDKKKKTKQKRRKHTKPEMVQDVFFFSK